MRVSVSLTWTELLAAAMVSLAVKSVGCGGADFYGLREGCEAVACDRDGVDAVGEAFEDGGAGFVGGVGFAEVVGVGGEGDRGADGGAGGVGDSEAEVADVGLGGGEVRRK